MADVFISYSRKDIAFARLLYEGLNQAGVETWIDWARIPVGEKWWNEISTAISQSDIFLFIISGHSTGSEVCKKEVDLALSHNKRIIPVIVDETPEAAIREFVPDLTAINWIIFRQDEVFQMEARPDEKLKPEEQMVALAKMPAFGQAVEKLNTAIHTDWVWVKAHTRLGTRAQEWDQSKREGSRLLRGKDLVEAEGWLAQAGARKDPQPTDLQRQFVLASRKAESRRQRTTLGASLGALGIISICLVVAVVLGVLAVQAQQTAERNLARSESLRLAAEAENILTQPYGNVETAALLSLRALQGGYTPQADAPLQKSLPRLYATHTFSGHTDMVESVAFSPDGKFGLTGSVDGTAKLWDAATGAEVRTFSGHAGPVESVAFSPDGKFVLTGSSDQTAKLWDSASGVQVRTFSDPTSIVRTSVEKKRSCHSVAFSPDGMTVLTGSDDGVAKLWEVATSVVVRSFIGHTNIVRSVAYSPDGKFVLTGGLDATARLWDAVSGEELRSFVLSGWVLSAAFSSDGKYVLTGGTNDDPTLWDAETGEVVRTFIGDAKGAVSVAFSPDGKYVLTGSLGQPTAKLWDAVSGEIVRSFSGHTGSVTAVTFSPDGKYVLTGSMDTTAKQWIATGNAEVRTFNGHTGPVWSAAFSPDGKTVLTGSDDGTARLWDAVTFEKVHTFSGHTDIVNSVAFSPDGKTVLTGSNDGTARLWDAATGAVVRTFSGYTGAVWSVAFSPDGKYVLTGSRDRTARLWIATTGEEVRAFNGHTQGVISGAFSPDGRTVLTGSIDWDAKLWDAATGAEVRTFKGESSVEGVAYSPDGKYVLTGNYERTATLWDAATGLAVRTFSGHTSYVGGVAFSPDGKYLLTSSSDKTAKLWETATGVEVRTFSGHTDAVNSVAFSPDGKYVLTGSTDKTAALWDTDSNDTVLWACAHLTRDLTPEERTRYFITQDTPTCPEGVPALDTQSNLLPLETPVPDTAPAISTEPDPLALATAAFLMPLTPTPNPLFPPPLEWEVTISDPFSSNGNGWPTFINKNDNCSVSTLGFQNDTLLWSLDAEEGYWCSYYYYPDILSVSDFDTSLDLKRSSGSGKADFGIVFRVNEAGYYVFVISDTTQTFQVRRMLNDASTTLEAWKKEPAISSDGTNRLAVSARGNVFYFYINDTLVDTLEDSEIDSGHIGIISEIYDGGEVSISYDNFLLQGIK